MKCGNCKFYISTSIIDGVKGPGWGRCPFDDKLILIDENEPCKHPGKREWHTLFGITPRDEHVNDFRQIMAMNAMADIQAEEDRKFIAQVSKIAAIQQATETPEVSSVKIVPLESPSEKTDP